MGMFDRASQNSFNSILAPSKIGVELAGVLSENKLEGGAGF
jgi:hypothetical protein